MDSSGGSHPKPRPCTTVDGWKAYEEWDKPPINWSTGAGFLPSVRPRSLFWSFCWDIFLSLEETGATESLTIEGPTAPTCWGCLLPWPFQVPKMEEPTAYRAYESATPLRKRICPRVWPCMVQCLHFRVQKISLNSGDVLGIRWDIAGYK